MPALDWVVKAVGCDYDSQCILLNARVRDEESASASRPRKPVMAQSAADFVKVHAATIARLHSMAAESLPILKSALTADQFAAALQRSADSHFGKRGAAAQAVQAYLESLHVPDLALACACANGSDAAWEHFMSAFRPNLYAAARAVAGESAGRDLADSLYADLYGLKEREGCRQSLFNYFHGRSKLSTWLRAVLAQRHVDAVRAARRTVSLDEEKNGPAEAPRSNFTLQAESGGGRQMHMAVAAELEPDRTRYLATLQAALTTALRALESRDRLRLCCYYVQDLTLAQIGRLLGEHEATVSRKLDRVRAELRRDVERILCEDRKFSDAQVRLCFEYAAQEWPFDLAGVLSERTRERTRTEK